MRVGPIVVVVGKCPALYLALGALEDLELRVRVIPTVPEAERALLGANRPKVSAVLVSLVQEPEPALALIRSVRERGGLAAVPIAVWSHTDSCHLLADAYEAGASSAVLVDGSHEDPIRLARMIHYWAVANEPQAEEHALA